MNLYKFHSEPESMNHYEFHYDNVVELFWDKYEDDHVELKKREKAIAEDAYYAYRYAYAILQDRFPLGEEAIVKFSRYTHLYAKEVIKGPWTINGKTYK